MVKGELQKKKEDLELIKSFRVRGGIATKHCNPPEGGGRVGGGKRGSRENGGGRRGRGNGGGRRERRGEGRGGGEGGGGGRRMKGGRGGDLGISGDFVKGKLALNFTMQRRISKKRASKK